MSFYGQVLYEFSKLFSNINIENNDGESASADSPVNQPSLAPTEEWDQLNLEGGNRWIHLNSDSINKTISISHASPSENGTAISILTPIDDVDKPDSGIIPLSQGQCIKASNYTYDNTGHIAGVEDQYFSLPVAQGYDDFVELQNRLSVVEESYVSNDESDSFNNLTAAYLTQNQYVKQDALEDSIRNYLKAENYVTTSLTGTLDTMHGGNSTSSITETIGAVNQSTNSIRSEFNTFFGLPEETTYTISEAILKLLNTIKEQDASITTLQLANTALKGKIEELEKKLTN